MNMNKIIMLLLVIVSTIACNTIPQYPESVLGYKPIYANSNDLKNITFSGPMNFMNPGKIYKYANYSYQIDVSNGIHIIDISNPTAPQRVKFISIPGCSEISIKNNILYADNFRDLVAINIANLNNPELLSRQSNVFPQVSNMPPANGVYFECVDPDLGQVVGWKQENIENPKCYKP